MSATLMSIMHSCKRLRVKQIQNLRACSPAYQIDVRTIVVVKDGRYLHKLREDLVVARHIGGQDAADDALPYGAVVEVKIYI